ncbi:MAG: glycosyltransferase [Dehalococcoidia bacterium]|nr:glycosyltransferase [Dehalococcoidia bacterium]
MRIVQISAHTSPLAPLGGRETGGMNVYVRELSHELARLGYDVDMVTRQDGTGPDIEELAPHLRILRIEAGPAAPLEKEELAAYLPAFATNLIAAMPADGYDIVHSHYWQSAVAGHQLAETTGAPHVVMFHTLGEVKNRARVSEREPVTRIQSERTIASTAAAIVTASEHEKTLLETYYDADPARMHTVPCGVDLDLFQPADRLASRRELGLDPATPVILWVGRLEKLKGVDILINAVAQLDDRDVTLLIVGGDQRSVPLKSELLAQALDAGLETNVRFEGAVPHERLPLYYSAADVCVVPSYYESFGLVAVEAMACGTPVVASRVGGLVSTVTDGVNGYLIPWRCPEPFAEKLEVLLHNPELRANFGRAARKSVERFRWRRIALEIAALYDDALAATHSTPERPPFGKEAYEAAALARR